MPSAGSGDTPNDKIKYIFNPLNGSGLTPTAKFNPDRIVTNSLNSAGGPRVVWNPATSTYVSDGPSVVVDNNGDVVVVGN